MKTGLKDYRGDCRPNSSFKAHLKSFIHGNISNHVNDQKIVTMEIQNSTIGDIDEIFRMYKWATNLQRVHKAVPWPEFHRELIKREIAQNRHWKAVDDGKIACIWSTAFDDPLIWEERNKDPAVYIHRIATHPSFRGNNLVSTIVQWALGYAKAQKKAFIRIDTVGKNENLIKHYKKCGFRFLGLFELKNTVGLPAHYHNATVSLFEIDLKSNN